MCVCGHDQSCLAMVKEERNKEGRSLNQSLRRPPLPLPHPNQWGIPLESKTKERHGVNKTN